MQPLDDHNSPQGARHFIDKNALCPLRCQTPDYALKAARVPGTWVVTPPFEGLARGLLGAGQGFEVTNA
jgi:hypothetical protein